LNRGTALKKHSLDLKIVITLKVIICFILLRAIEYCIRIVLT